MTLNDVMAALGVVINGIPQALLALSVGFAAFPTSLGYALGVIACALLQSPIPISMQAETIALAGSYGKNVRERLSVVFWAGIIMTILGISGSLNFIVDLAGENVLNGMMAGVGLILAKIAIDGLKLDTRMVSLISILTALITYFVSDRNLVYTIIISVVISSIYANIKKMEIGKDIKEEERKLSIKKPLLNKKTLRGGLSLACLTIGANIAFGNITASLSNKDVVANIDHLTIYSGLADTVSSLFGGAPVEAIISATGASDNPVNSGILMMVILGAIMFMGFLPKLGKYVPGESIHGFLFVLGALVTVPTNANIAFASGGDTALVAGIAMATTAASDPFIGLVAGIILKLIIL